MVKRTVDVMFFVLDIGAETWLEEPKSASQQQRHHSEHNQVEPLTPQNKPVFAQKHSSVMKGRVHFRTNN